MSRNLRHIFDSWKKGIVFLEWGSDELELKDRLAKHHLKHRIVQQWRALASDERAAVEARASVAARGCLLRFPLRLWRLLLRASELRKSLLMSRGIDGLRVLVRRGRVQRQRLRRTCEEAPDLRLRGCLRRWQRRALERAYYQHRPPPPPPTPPSSAPPSFASVLSPSKLSTSTSSAPPFKALPRTHTQQTLTKKLPSVSMRLADRGMRGVWHEDQFQYRLQQLHRRKGFSALLKWAHSASRMR
jgi:hypothetical protein